MYMKIGKGLNIRIIDSLNFLPMPLSSLPKAFGLTELKKGYFPHLFNTPQNQNAILQGLPDARFYSPEGMTSQKREEFQNWYNQNKHNIFDFQKEIVDYCISDVDILMNACLKFKQLLQDETRGSEEIFQEQEEEEEGEEGEGEGERKKKKKKKKKQPKGIDPFSFLTIASVCMGIFRCKFLPEKWSVVLKENSVENCKHKDEDCGCLWSEARILSLQNAWQVLVDGHWINVQESLIVRKKFLSSPIGLIPNSGYSGRNLYSVEALQWLKVKERELQEKYNCPSLSVQTAVSSIQGEKVIYFKDPERKKLIKYKLDGYCETECGEKIALEYHGCNWHGCLFCFPNSRNSISNQGKSLDVRFRETLLKESRLRQMGLTVISKWSCEFKEDVMKSEELQKFISECDMQKGIHLRDCFFGGRVNGVVLYKNFQNTSERGNYVDFTSLYPAVMKHQKFPVGHPERITCNFQQPFSVPCSKPDSCDFQYGLKKDCPGSHVHMPYFGIMRVTILPPTDLYIPVLPVRYGKKLKFPLCFSCAKHEQVSSPCNCCDSQRQFTETYCTPEIELALNVGYKLIAIHEVLHWKETEQYNKCTKEGGLFTKYINKFLKVKQESSGLPDENVDIDEYIDTYRQHEGIVLERDKIEKNSGLRSLGELALNSFFGKFGQGSNKVQTALLTELGDLYSILLDPAKKLTGFHIISENMLQVEYKYNDDFEPLPLNINVVICAFCTCWGRVKLYHLLNSLGKRVMYFDTDSVIFSSDTNKENEFMPHTGNFLGELTNELSCKDLNCSRDSCQGHYIVEFVCCGPKNYSYKLNTGEVVCKVRGFSLSHQNSLLLNFESMKESLMCWKKGEKKQLITVKTEIQRDKLTSCLYTKQVEKQYGVVLDKRQVLDDFTTVPFGYMNE